MLLHGEGGGGGHCLGTLSSPLLCLLCPVLMGTMWHVKGAEGLYWERWCLLTLWGHVRRKQYMLLQQARPCQSGGTY